MLFKKASEYGPEIPQSHTAGQRAASWGRARAMNVTRNQEDS